MIQEFDYFSLVLRGLMAYVRVESGVAELSVTPDVICTGLLLLLTAEELDMVMVGVIGMLTIVVLGVLGVMTLGFVLALVVTRFVTSIMVMPCWAALLVTIVACCNTVGIEGFSPAVAVPVAPGVAAETVAEAAVEVGVTRLWRMVCPCEAVINPVLPMVRCLFIREADTDGYK